MDGMYDWVKEHIIEGAPLNEADHCGDPPLLLAAGNGASFALDHNLHNASKICF